MVRILHWSVVFSIVMAYVTAYYRYWYTTQTEAANWYLLVIHINFGLLILILSIIMFVSRYCSYKRAGNILLLNKVLLKPSVKIMHYTLYFMLISLPVSALIGTGFDIPIAGVINIPGFFRSEFIQQLLQQHFDMLMITFIEPFASYHRDIASDIILPILLIGHVGAAIMQNKIK
jgi:cytochrome b561